LLSATGGEVKAAISDKLQDHTDHVPVRQQAEQLAGEAAVPYGIIGSRQIDKNGSGLLLERKAVLDVLSHQSDLVYGRSPASEPGLLLREQWVDDRFDAGVDKTLEDLEGDAEQGDGTVALRIPFRLIRFRDRDN
jgi:hypothetical protein